MALEELNQPKIDQKASCQRNIGYWVFVTLKLISNLTGNANSYVMEKATAVWLAVKVKKWEINEQA